MAELTHAIKQALDADLARMGGLDVDTMKLAQEIANGDFSNAGGVLKRMQMGHPEFTPEDDRQRAFQQDMLDGENGEGAYEGMAWRPHQVEALGRQPEPRELSPGGKQLHGMNSRIDFLDKLRKAHEGHVPGFFEDPWGAIKSRISTKEKLIADALSDYQNSQTQTHGHSGWLGALTNPEYFLGNGITQTMQPFSEAASAHASDPKSNWNHPDWIGNPDSLDPNDRPTWENLPARLLQLPALLATSAPEYFTKHLPAAADQADAARIFNKVNPQLNLPKEMSGLDADKQVHEGRSLYAKLSGLDADDEYRMRNREFPSMAVSQLMSMGNGLIDPTMLAFPLATAAKSAATGAKVTARGVLKGLASHAGEEATEEMFQSPALQVPMLAHQDAVDDASEAAGYGRGRGNMNWNPLASGDDRTDLHVQDPKTGEWRPERHDEFDARVGKLHADRAAAPNQVRAAVAQHGYQPDGWGSTIYRAWDGIKSALTGN